ncbi:hypothetical protein RIF29_16967 [Crotalaria pallida]|uniref:Uncharacterized protein n=1 Tax=Crotalaria pallida TaxID=3830 RepID=A0AAN9FIC5_CROPI
MSTNSTVSATINNAGPPVVRKNQFRGALFKYGPNPIQCVYRFSIAHYLVSKGTIQLNQYSDAVVVGKATGNEVQITKDMEADICEEQAAKKWWKLNPDRFQLVYIWMRITSFAL